MASNIVNTSITVGFDLRPCIVKDEKYLFHRWVQEFHPVESFPGIGAIPNDQVSQVYALIEDMEGNMHHVSSLDIHFLDTKERSKKDE